MSDLKKESVIDMPIIEINGDFSNVGINTRKQTAGVELDMVNSFIEYRKSRFNERSEKQLAIFVEPKINNAYPDIVFAEYNPFAFEKWTDVRNDIEISDLKILNYIYCKKETSSEQIIKELSVKYKGLLISLEKLYDSNLISRINRKWVISDPDFIGVKKIETVEAKISKWNEVFQQALLNKNFASESSVLSKRKADPSDTVFSTFNEFGIGIYLFNDIEFSTVSKAQKKRIPINHNSLFINECIGKILNN